MYGRGLGRGLQLIFIPLDSGNPAFYFSEHCMGARFQVGDCVRVSDGRIGRVRARVGRKLRVRVRRRTSETHQFLLVAPGELRPVQCPKGWMSPAGYRGYLRPTLAKLRARLRARRAR